MIDDEGNEFPIGLMVVEGEYLTLDGKSRRTSGHVFMDWACIHGLHTRFCGLSLHKLDCWHEQPSTDNVKEELNQGTLLLALFIAR